MSSNKKENTDNFEYYRSPDIPLVRVIYLNIDKSVKKKIY